MPQSAGGVVAAARARLCPMRNRVQLWFMRHRHLFCGISLVIGCSAPAAPSRPSAPAAAQGAGATAPGAAAPAGTPAEVGLEGLAPGKSVHGFTAKAVYLDGA